MGVRFPSALTGAVLASVPATGAETVIATTAPLITPLDQAVVFIFWRLLFTVGVGTTAVSLRIRRGTVVGAAQVDADTPVTVTAGNVVVLSGTTFDNPGAAAGQQYSVTLAGTGTTGAFTNSNAVMLAFAL